MKSITIILTLFVGVILFAACKKDSAQKSVTEQVQGTWSFNKLISTVYGVGATSDTIYGLPGDYVEFRNDGRAYSQISASRDTANYQIIGTSQMVFDGDTFSIRTLTENNFTLYSRTQNVGVGGYAESSVYLNR